MSFPYLARWASSGSDGTWLSVGMPLPCLGSSLIPILNETVSDTSPEEKEIWAGEIALGGTLGFQRYLYQLLFLLTSSSTQVPLFPLASIAFSFYFYVDA